MAGHFFYHSLDLPRDAPSRVHKGYTLLFEEMPELWFQVEKVCAAQNQGIDAGIVKTLNFGAHTGGSLLGSAAVEALFHKLDQPRGGKADH